MIHRCLCSLIVVFVFLLSAFCVLPSAFGQSTTATLSGTVTDQNGAVVSAVEITVENIGTALRRQTITNDEGYFTVPLLPPSTYSITAQRTGFTPVRIANVVLNVGDQKSLPIQLKAGNISEMVQISADAPLINESPAVGTVVDRQFIGNLPLNGRTFQSLISLTPGVVQTKSSTGSQGQLSVNGQRDSANYFTVDGVSANIGVNAAVGLNQSDGGTLPAFNAQGGTNNLVSVDALQEFKIQTSTYAPEFGRQPGAQVSIVTRSGTNEFHGTIFDYFRNDALDSTDWFANANRLQKPPLRQNDFGGVLGGPVLLPRFGEGSHQPWYNGRNRTFFFFSYEGLRLRLPQTAISAVPTLTARQTATPGITPFLNAYPIPNGADLGNGFAQFSASYSDPSTLNATSIRIDQAIGSKLSTFVRYNYAVSETTQRAASTSVNTLSTTRVKTRTLTGNATLQISPTISNDFRANYSKNNGGGFLSQDNFGGASLLSESLLFPSPFSKQDAVFSFLISGGTNTFLSTGKTADNSVTQVNLVDNLFLIKDTHQLKFGVDYRHISTFSSPRLYRLAAQFSNMNTARAGTASVVTVQASTSFPLLVNNFSAFAQDTWKASKRMTLTYGLRWELNPPPKGGDGVTLISAHGLENAATLTLAPPGTPLYKTTYNNFAPRVGIAYRVFQHAGKETILRGGFGTFYDLGTQTSGNLAISFPFDRTKRLLNTVFPLDPASAAPLPFTLSLTAPVSTFFAFDPHLKLPRTYQWNFAIEQSLGANQTLSASYVGASGRRLLQVNRLPNPNPSFQLLLVTRNAATSDYHSLQLQFQRRMSRGLQVLASHTWSHSIDTLSNDAADVDQARGPSDFDVRHSFAAAVSYNLPNLTLNEVGRAISRGWAIDAIITARSAAPVNVIAQQLITLTGLQVNIRPDLSPGIPLYLSDPTAPAGRRLNDTVVASRPGCKGPFCPPPAGRQGTLGRNALRGFNASQINLGVRRQFNLTERWNLQFKSELFNVFNHPNFGDPGANNNSTHVLTNGLFGRSTQMLGRSLGGTNASTGGLNPLYQNGGPRSIQFVLKLQF
jgi:hypothetical protein